MTPASGGFLPGFRSHEAQARFTPDESHQFQLRFTPGVPCSVNSSWVHTGCVSH